MLWLRYRSALAFSCIETRIAEFVVTLSIAIICASKTVLALEVCLFGRYYALLSVYPMKTQIKIGAKPRSFGAKRIPDQNGNEALRNLLLSLAPYLER
jgi:hypothetical protein